MNTKTNLIAALSLCLPLCPPLGLFAQTNSQATDQVGSKAAVQQNTETSASVDHPLRNDPTGINWAFSLDEAIQKAKETNRIMILKPVSYRSEVNSERLSPSSEVQRAMAFVDQRVVNLLNRRFVLYYYDMDKLGAQYDEVAADLAREMHPDMRFMSMPTPPLLFVTAERKMLGYASNFLSADELLARLVEILEENPSYKALTTAERVVTNPIEKAWMHYELRDFEGAIDALDQQQDSEAYYLRLLIANEQQNWIAMKDCIKLIMDPQRKLDVDVENIIRYWKIKNMEGIKAKGKRIKKNQSRYQEAMYYLGLAQYHTKEKEEAIKTWTNAIEHDRNSAWAIRLDLALGLLKLNPNEYLSAQDKIPSLLGLTYMCPNGLEDLAKLDD